MVIKPVERVKTYEEMEEFYLSKIDDLRAMMNMNCNGETTLSHFIRLTPRCLKLVKMLYDAYPRTIPSLILAEATSKRCRDIYDFQKDGTTNGDNNIKNNVFHANKYFKSHLNIKAVVSDWGQGYRMTKDAYDFIKENINAQTI